MEKRYPRWKVILGFVGFMAMMGIVGRLEQVPDVESPQAVLDERVYVRDQLRSAQERQAAQDQVFIAEMERIGRGEK